MRTEIPEKVVKIIDDVETNGRAPLTRLTVLKKWFERPGRLPAFGLWIARRAAGRKGKTKGAAGALLDEARAMLGTSATREGFLQQIDPTAGKVFHDRIRDFQNEFENQRWNRVRIIKSWPLLLVEKGLALHLSLTISPSDGYKLTADWAQHYDSRFGTCLCGPSCGKLHELVRFMFNMEALEDQR